MSLSSTKNIVVHIGCMRCASTHLQALFNEDPRIALMLKTRFFSYNPYYGKGFEYLNKVLSIDEKQEIIIDSDENYSLGRFKHRLINYADKDFSYRKELSVIYHDIFSMAERIKSIYPNASILMVIRNQADWIKSVYKHDIQHFGIDSDFESFLKSDLGIAYKQAADFNNLHSVYSSLFGRDNVKVLLFENIRNYRNLFYKNLSEAVGLSLSPIDLNGKGKNASRSDSLIYFQRILNKISQHDPDKKERKLYYYPKVLLSWSEKIIKNNFKRELVTAKQTQTFKNEFVESNKALAREIQLHDQMEQSGYF